MGVDNLATFRDMVNLALGTKSQTNERLDAWLNAGLEELFVMLDIEGRRTCGQATTVADQERYSLPTTLVAVLVLTDQTNKKRLLKISLENFEKLDPAKTGRPTHYMRVNRDIWLYPIPDGAYTLQMFYIKSPTRLSSSSDVTELTSAYDRVIHLLGVRNALLDLNDTERATTFYQTAINTLRLIPTEEWLESATPSEGIQIARSQADLQKP